MRRLCILILFLFVAGPGFVASAGGAIPLESEQLTRHLPDPCVSRLVFDGLRVWVGTAGGLATYEPALDEWRVFGPAEGLRCPFVTAILPVDTDEAWLGTSFSPGAGLYHYSRQKITRHPLVGDDDLHVTALGRHRGRLYAGTFGRGLFVFDPENSRSLPGTDPFITDLATQGPVLYAASKYAGVFRLTEDTVEVIDDHTSVLLHNSVGAIIAPGTDEIWFGCWGGAARVKGGEWTTFFRHPQQLSHPHVTCLAADGINVYLGTDAGVSVYNRARGTFIHFTGEDIPLPSERIFALCKVGNHLWIGTDKGLIRIGIR